MTNKIYHLSSCSTCRRIIGTLDTDLVMQDIKEAPITKEQLDELRKRVGSYED